ncbi:PREDICTED: rho-related GTP-binding protein RhoN-like, partial [Pterocles gutturalis]|uniref:rho-related GTP-binding protein RhoN-like n=1 Tax=Pterocles gutturalis TaxID=240206 RepID=UPI0005285C13
KNCIILLLRVCSPLALVAVTPEISLELRILACCRWQGETQEFCPNAKIVLVGCKLDMRTDLNTLRELSKQRLIPVTHEQGSALARQIGAVAYAECSSKVSENSVRDVFHVTTLASVNRMHKNLKRSNSKRGLKRASQMPGRTDLLSDTEIRKDRAKSCSIM